MVTPQRVSVTMFHVGFGDCFLVSVDYGPGAAPRERHVLVDFGSKDASGDALRRVAEAIRHRCGGHLEVVVVSHRHQDHLSGFGQSDAAQVIEDCGPKVVLRSWTEHPDLPEDGRGPLRSLAQGAEFAAALMDQRFALQETEPGRILRDVAPLQIANAAAVGRLQHWSGQDGGRAGRYLSYGDDPKLGDLLPGVRVHVLGPPTPADWSRIVRQRREDADEFWLALRRAIPTMLAVEPGDAPDGSSAEELVLGPDGHASDGPAPGDIGPVRWLTQKLRAQQVRSLTRIVTWLDDALNNTSLILAFEIGDRLLLFPGDAQIEEWEWALQGAPDAAANLQSMRDIDLYKVGHHGSRNATPKLSLYPLWGRGRRRKLMVLCSTRSGVYRKREEVPDPDLIAALAARPFELHRPPDDKASADEASSLEVSARASGSQGFRLVPP